MAPVQRRHPELHLGEHRPHRGHRREPPPVHRADGDQRQHRDARVVRAGPAGRPGPRLGPGAVPGDLRRPVPGARAVPERARGPACAAERPEPAGPARRPGGLHPHPARRGRPVRRSAGGLRPAVRRADDDLAVPARPVRQIPRPDGERPRLRPHTGRRPDLGGVLPDRPVVQRERHLGRPVRHRPPGPPARLPDERLQQRAVVLRRATTSTTARRWGGWGRRIRARAGSAPKPRSRARSSTTGCSASPTRPRRRGTGTAWAPRSAPAGWRCAPTGTSSRPATSRCCRARSTMRRCPRARPARPTCTAAPG